jgi:prepilin-type N-terminal cleavage/methylation domain-containing protein
MRRGGDSGFTLVEVLVALVILGVTGVAVLQLVSGGLRLAGASGAHVDATLLASAKLAEVEAGPLEEGASEGREGAYQWTRRVTLERELLPVEQDRPETTAVRLARVTVEVRWGVNRRVEMVTLRAWRGSS